MSPLYYDLLRSNNGNSALLLAQFPQPRPSRFDGARSTAAALAENCGAAASIRAASSLGIVRRRGKADAVALERGAPSTRRARRQNVEPQRAGRFRRGSTANGQLPPRSPRTPAPPHPRGART